MKKLTLQAGYMMIPAMLIGGSLLASTAYAGVHQDFLNNLTQEQQDILQEAHDLRQSGELDEAQKLIEGSGIDLDELRKAHQALHQQMRQHHEEMEEIIDDNDYDAFKELVNDTPLAEKITSKSDFEQFVKAHELMQDGEYDEAKDIVDKLGIERPGPMHNGNGHHRGFRNTSQES